MSERNRKPIGHFLSLGKESVTHMDECGSRISRPAICRADLVRTSRLDPGGISWLPLHSTVPRSPILTCILGSVAKLFPRHLTADIKGAEALRSDNHPLFFFESSSPAKLRVIIIIIKEIGSPESNPVQGCKKK